MQLLPYAPALLIAGGAAAPISHGSVNNNLKSNDLSDDITIHVLQSRFIPHRNSTAIALSRADKRGQWAWERPLQVIGTMPDGSPKCRIYSATAGNVYGSCPKKLSQEELLTLIHKEWCKNNPESREQCPTSQKLDITYMKE